MAKQKEKMLTELGLTDMAREAFDQSELTQAEAAERLKVGQGAISVLYGHTAATNGTAADHPGDSRMGV